MADPHYILEENPVYDEAIRALQDSDPARASTTFNPVLLGMLNNTHHVKKALDAHDKADTAAHTELQTAVSAAQTALETHKADRNTHVTTAEKAAWTAKETPAGAQAKADVVQGSLNTHTANGAIHVTASEKAAWDAKETPDGAQAKVEAVQANLNAHTNNTTIHVTKANKDVWDAAVPPSRKIAGKPLSTDVALSALTFTGATSGTYDGSAAKTINIPEGGGKRVARFTVGTSTAGWTAKDCDYLCDGVADDVEINAAIQALPVSGGELVILDGTYNISDPINMLKPNTKLSGNGKATALKRLWNRNANEGIVSVNATSCTVSNLFFDGNKAEYTSSSNNSIQVNSSDSIISGNVCVNSGGIGISLHSNDNIIVGNICTDNFGGIYLKIASNNTITGNRCNNNGYYGGIYLYASANNAIVGNEYTKNKTGITLGNKSKDNTLTGNNCNNNTENGIYINDHSDNNTISSNTSSYNNNNSLYSAIEVSFSDNNAVTGNTCTSNGHGIRLYGGNNNTVTGNLCHNNNFSGVCLSRSSTNNMVTGNTALCGSGLESDYTVSKHTIYLQGTENKNNLIADNMIMGKNYTSEGGTGNTFVNNKYN